jgi:hypothetical protein
LTQQGIYFNNPAARVPSVKSQRRKDTRRIDQQFPAESKETQDSNHLSVQISKNENGFL